MSDRPSANLLAQMYPGGEAKSNADLMALDDQGHPLFYRRWWSDDGTRTTRPADREVRKAGASQEITKEALDSAAVDLRQVVRSDLTAKLLDFTNGSVWTDEPKFEEFQTTRSVGIYADDADWDDEDNPPEPIGYKDIEVVLIRASIHFAL